jgi:hypothetical protein
MKHLCVMTLPNFNGQHRTMIVLFLLQTQEENAQEETDEAERNACDAAV